MFKTRKDEERRCAPLTWGDILSVVLLASFLSEIWGMCLMLTIQDACLGILRAIDLFKPGESTRFSTYAAYFAEGKIRRLLRLDVQRAIETCLTPREAQVVRMRFDEDLPQREIAQRMGTYQMKVSRILKHSLDKLSDELAEEEME